MGPKLSKKNETAASAEPTLALESHKISNIARVSFPMDERFVEIQKLTQIMQLVPFARHQTESERQAIVLRALDMYQSLKPADGLQGMLAEQMVGTHFAGLESLRLLASANDLRAREMYMKQAEKLMALYLKQITALTTLQGGGQQNIQVGQVNVAEGGQAIVGNVQTSASDRAPRARTANRGAADLDGTEVEP